MTTAPDAFPLAWPAHKPRTPNSARKNGRFTSNGADLTVAVAAARVEDEVEKLRGKNLLISTNVQVTLSGRPRSSQPEPADRGVCVYFQLGAEPFAMACDKYLTVADNLAAIAKHIDSVRGQERWGVVTAAEALRVFVALPSYGAQPTVRPWRDVMGFTDALAVTRVRIAERFRQLAAERHPDKPHGSEAAMAELNAARDAALAETAE